MRASELFRIECQKLPDHTMHVHARMLVSLYLAKRYRTYSMHKRRIAKALHSIDRAYNAI